MILPSSELRWVFPVPTSTVASKLFSFLFSLSEWQCSIFRTESNGSLAWKPAQEENVMLQMCGKKSLGKNGIFIGESCEKKMKKETVEGFNIQLTFRAQGREGESRAHWWIWRQGHSRARRPSWPERGPRGEGGTGP